MAQILAVEPDAERSVILRRLVKQSLNHEIVIVRSADEAINRIVDTEPDVILTSSLLAPGEDEHIAAHLRLSPTLDHLPVLTIPPVVAQTSPEQKRGMLAWLLPSFRRRRRHWPAYDFGAVAARIEDALEQSKIDAERSEPERPARLMLLEAKHPLLLEAGRDSDIPPQTTLVRLDAELRAFADPGVRARLDRAHRWDGRELPWLHNLTLTWGPQLRVVNISTSGLLVESGIRFTLGNREEFQFEIEEQELIIRARVVRSDVASVGSLGVKYTAAAVFDKPFENLERQSFESAAPGASFVRRIA
jgi:CheY-like chemotaxis protein